ncbi:MAG: lamin tail domain-containing protein [Methanotrichaceae archaeon]|nr:lamin tail domain-containing protein [Methanotrichaceae archaeon]
MRNLCAQLVVLLSLILAFCVGSSLGQDANNTTELQAPELMETTELLSNATPATEVLGKRVSGTYQDVTQTSDVESVFSRNPSLNVNITDANTAENWLEITNQGIAATDLSGWSILSGGDVTFVFPAYELAGGESVKVREGAGVGAEGEIYTNSTNPLWSGNVVTLIDPSGAVAGQYDISVPKPAPVVVKDPYEGRIQY